MAATRRPGHVRLSAPAGNGECPLPLPPRHDRVIARPYGSGAGRPPASGGDQPETSQSCMRDLLLMSWRRCRAPEINQLGTGGPRPWRYGASWTGSCRPAFWHPAEGSRRRMGGPRGRGAEYCRRRTGGEVVVPSRRPVSRRQRRSLGTAPTGSPHPHSGRCPQSPEKPSRPP